MPYKSLAQERWAHTSEGRKALGSKLKEYDQASKGLDLPAKVTTKERSRQIESPSKIMKRKNYSGSPHVTASRMN